MAISGFEGLVVWQKARALSVEVYRVAGSGRLARDFGLKDQMQRASVSVMSNIAEGYDRNSLRELARYISIARGSLGELKSQLYLAQDLGYVPEEECVRLRSRCTEVTRMLVSLRNSIERGKG